MGVAVLQPHDTLRNKPSNHYQTITSPMKIPNPNSKPHRTPRNRKKRFDPSPQDVPVSVSGLARPNKPYVNNKPLLTGQVKILKRGQQLTETTPDLQPPRPQTETVSSPLPSTEKVEGLYAGYSMLVMSPPPSSVPLPAFITKKIAAVSDATSDLRKMLRLDFP